MHGLHGLHDGITTTASQEESMVDALHVVVCFVLHPVLQDADADTGADINIHAAITDAKTIFTFLINL
jgi:hypothetical protein